jgi:hypothetical protein
VPPDLPLDLTSLVERDFKDVDHEVFEISLAGCHVLFEPTDEFGGRSSTVSLTASACSSVAA